EGILDVLYDYDVVRRTLTGDYLATNKRFDMFRYLPVLPISSLELVPQLQIGWTPLYAPQALRKELGCRDLYVKDDGRNPTASLKDRASGVGVTRARELGYEVICAASTGNAATSLSGLAASVGIQTVIFVPERAPKAKLAQLLIFGSTVVMVKGSYDEAFELSIGASEHFNWYNRNCGYNPYLVEGKKTGIWEVLEQLDFEVPDLVFTPLGDGCITSSIHKGLKDMHALGLINRMPRIIAVQAAGACPLKTAWETGRPLEPVVADTLADSIAVGHPRNALKALKAIRQTDGEVMAVSDDEILEAMRVLGRLTGVFGEPAGVTAMAGVMQARSSGRITGQEKIVVMITGNGLKDVDSAIKASGEPLKVAPDMDEVVATLSEKF
ncbi:MAG: threonine synthase, partial [bacterium]|nr:threonine synthase [bacterium]